MKNNLTEFRDEIDQIDDEIFQLLEKRFLISKQVGKLKRDLDINVLDNRREEFILSKIENLNLQNSEEVIMVYKTILKESKKLQ